MTDKKDDETNVVVGPWGDTQIEINGLFTVHLLVQCLIIFQNSSL